MSSEWQYPCPYAKCVDCPKGQSTNSCSKCAWNPQEQELRRTAWQEIDSKFTIKPYKQIQLVIKHKNGKPTYSFRYVGKSSKRSKTYNALIKQHYVKK